MCFYSKFLVILHYKCTSQFFITSYQKAYPKIFTNWTFYINKEKTSSYDNENDKKILFKKLITKFKDVKLSWLIPEK